MKEKILFGLLIISVIIGFVVDEEFIQDINQETVEEVVKTGPKGGICILATSNYGKFIFESGGELYMIQYTRLENTLYGLSHYDVIYSDSQEIPCPKFELITGDTEEMLKKNGLFADFQKQLPK